MEKSGIGIFLRQYRISNHLSREALAETLDISDAYLAALELGTRKPAYDTLVKIINTLKVSADDVLGVDGYVGKLHEAADLSAQLSKLDANHSRYAVAALKLILESFSKTDHA